MQTDELCKKILKKAETERVKFVHMVFMDILGTSKSVTIPVSKLEKALSDGVVFDGSSVVGYATIEESDMRAFPDLCTFQILPWGDGDLKTARFVCNIFTPDGKRFDGDPRYVLEKMINKAKEEGYIFNTGPEYEFFLFKLNEQGNPSTTLSDYGRYFDLMPVDKGDMIRKEIIHYLNAMNLDAEASHHEVSHSQHEIDLRYADAMTSADRVFLLKYAIKTIALNKGLHATFMPKPIFGINGSGMHVHQSLFSKEGKNLFWEEDSILSEYGAKYQLSKTALHYIAGLLKYAKENCAILASWVNSYKRLVPGYEAPVYISWANKNRSALVRVPAGKGMSRRVELRNPDPAGNPYLQFAVMLASGLKGIKDKLKCPEPVEKDIYHLSPEERKKLGIDSLPANLGHALSFLEQSKLMKETLGKHIFEHFIYVRQKEWDEFRTQVTNWEVEKYLPIL